MAVFPCADSRFAALGAMIPPVIVMTDAVALMNGYAAFTGTDDDFSGSRKGSYNGRGNSSAQNKQTHL
jgi:hypothetical protein